MHKKQKHKNCVSLRQQLTDWDWFKCCAAVQETHKYILNCIKTKTQNANEVCSSPKTRCLRKPRETNICLMWWNMCLMWSIWWSIMSPGWPIKSPNKATRGRFPRFLSWQSSLITDTHLKDTLTEECKRGKKSFCALGTLKKVF